MKSSEFHRSLRKNGWNHIRTSGSHYIYAKDGRTSPIFLMVVRKLERAFEKNHEGSGA